MGQDQSAPSPKNKESPRHEEKLSIKVNSPRQSRLATMGDLESVGDFESILQAFHTPIESPLSPIMSPCSDNSAEVVTNDFFQDTVNSVIHSRSNKFIQHISQTYPECEEIPSTRIRVATMVEVVQYADANTQLILSTASKYLYKVVRTSCISAEIRCSEDWVEAINKSAFLSSLSLRGESSPQDIRRFCRIIRNDGFPHLQSISFNYMSDENIQSILKALYTHIGRSVRLNIINANSSNTMAISISAYFLSSRICYAMADAITNGVGHVLDKLQLLTNDIEGLVNFFKIVDFSDCKKLSEIMLSNCPLQVKGFELVLRSIWPTGHHRSFYPPIRKLLLENTSIHDCGILSLTTIIERNALVDLEELDVSSNLLKKNAVKCLARAFNKFCCPKLRVFKCGNNNLSPGSTIELFNALTNGACPFLSEIDLENTRISAEDIIAFAEYISSPFSEYLSRVDISNNPLVTEGLCDFFTALTNQSNNVIKTLLLEGISISSKEILFFTEWLISGNAKCLRNVILKSNLIDSQGFCQLMKSIINPNCPKLEVIDFSSNLIGSFNEEEWNQVLQSDGQIIDFEQIDYSFNPLTDDDIKILMKFFTSFSRITHKKRLSFAGNAVSAKAFDYYFSSFPNTECSLVYLSIDSCSISGIGPYLYNFLNSYAVRKLQVLVLRDCSLIEEDLKYLMDGLDLGNCTQLNGLRLDGNGCIHDNFVKRFLTSVEKNSIPNLYNLDCAYTSITIVGLKVLLQFLIDHPYTRLSILDFSSSSISREERMEMKEEIAQAMLSGHFSV